MSFLIIRCDSNQAHKQKEARVTVLGSAIADATAFIFWKFIHLMSELSVSWHCLFRHHDDEKQ